MRYDTIQPKDYFGIAQRCAALNENNHLTYEQISTAIRFWQLAFRRMAVLNSEIINDWMDREFKHFCARNYQIFPKTYLDQMAQKIGA